MKTSLCKSTISNLRTYLEFDTSLLSGEHYPETIRFLRKQLDEFGFETKTIRIPKKIAPGPHRINLIARRFEDDSLPTMLIYNHIDVVAADYKGAFTSYIRKGRIYARGASDHKGGTAGVLDALKKLKDTPLRFNLIFIATTDEEVEQLDQLRFLGKKLKLPKNSMIFDTDTLAGGITVARLGRLNFKITVHGKPAHSCMSHLGRNSIEKASKIITYLIKTRKRFERQKSEYKPFPKIGVRYITSRCNVTMIDGGIAVNTIPERTILAVNARFLPEMDAMVEAKKLVDKIQRFAKRKNIKISIKDFNVLNGKGVKNNKYAKELNKIYKKYEKTSGLYCASVSGPHVQWARELKIPIIGLGVMRKNSRIHGIDENARIKDIENVSKTLQEFLVDTK